VSYRKKLIEVALPLEAINRASAREKSIRHGHPSTLHLWWARRPLAACRAVLFAQLVDDPSEHPEEFPTPETQQAERQRLFRLIEELVKWENTNNEDILRQARAEIRKSAGGDPPPLLDPFCGGGSIPLEAQRLGLEAHASDLNPVAVLITKALIEIPPKFAGRPPVNPAWKQTECKDEGWQTAWTGAKGLAEDIRYYGKWVRDEAERRIGHLYPKVRLPAEDGGGEATVIAWLWARTVASPNPACGGAHVPLVRSFVLSGGKSEKVWLEPVVDRAANSYRFDIRRGAASNWDAVSSGTKIARGAKFRCLLSGQPIPDDYLKLEARAGRMGSRLIAIVGEGNGGRVYLAASPDHEKVARSAVPGWQPTQPLPNDPRNIWCVLYGLDTFDKLFTARQLATLSLLCDLAQEVHGCVILDAERASVHGDPTPLGEGGDGTVAYADAVTTYLGLIIDRLAMTGNSLVRWNSVGEKAQHVFGRQALPMVWDYAEPNFLGRSTGSISAAVELTASPLETLCTAPAGRVSRADAASMRSALLGSVVATDPPYYDNVSYADLSDFFYVWLRHSLSGVHPDLASTLLTPKAEELVAHPYRFQQGQHDASLRFEQGLERAFRCIAHSHSSRYPTVLFYAFRQTEESHANLDSADRTARVPTSTGWETMLEGLVRTSLAITGTWPIRTEMRTRQIAMGTNALASSIVISCRSRPSDAAQVTRREFLRALKSELPLALRRLQEGNVAPVDLAQAAIGPGMAVFSRYARVLEADGSPMKVRTALAIINQVLDEHFTSQEASYDSVTRWCLAWFEQYGLQDGPFGLAETLSKAKNTAVSGLVNARIAEARGGKVRLLNRQEYRPGPSLGADHASTVWQATHLLVRRLLDEGGERAAADLLKQVGTPGEAARDLAYHLYTICDRKSWSQDALAYNSLVVAWPEITRLASESASDTETGTQPRLLGEG